MMSLMTGGPPGASSERCMETEWRGLEAAPIFIAANHGNVAELMRLLQNPEMRRRVNDIEGDRCGILHGCALNAKGDDPAGIVHAIVHAGGNVNIKNGYQETPLQMAVLYTPSGSNRGLTRLWRES